MFTQTKFIFTFVHFSQSKAVVTLLYIILHQGVEGGEEKPKLSVGNYGNPMLRLSRVETGSAQDVTTLTSITGNYNFIYFVHQKS